MATTSLWPIHSTASRSTQAVVKQLVDYAENEKKTLKPGIMGPSQDPAAIRSVLGYVSQDRKVEDQDALQMVMEHMSAQGQGLRYVSGINCSPERAVEEMMLTKKRWPERGNRLLFHGYQSFLPGEVTPDQAHRIGVRLARELWKDRFEIVVATHLDRDHIHSHFVINTVSFLDGRKFDWDKEYPRMQHLSDEICIEEGLSVVRTSRNQERSRHKGEMRADQEGRPTIESIVKEDIDCCIEASDTFEEWLCLMRDKGYRIDDSRKYLRIFPYGHSRCIRVDRRFGEGYTLDGIASRINQKVMGVEQRQKTEEEAIREIYMELSAGRKGRPIPAGGPRGIQKRYVCFLFMIGYRKSPAQIARTHYLLREELTKLDRYIEESRFLIDEEIDTLEQLMERKKEDQREVNRLYRSKSKLESMLSDCGEEGRISVSEQIGRIEEQIKSVRKNLRSEKGILMRMGEMDRKEQKVEMILGGKTLQKGVGYKNKLEDGFLIKQDEIGL